MRRSRLPPCSCPASSSCASPAAPTAGRRCENAPVRLTARADYALRAAAELAAAAPPAACRRASPPLRSHRLRGIRTSGHRRLARTHEEDLTREQLEQLGLVRRQLRDDPLALAERQLDAHLEAEVDDALDERLEGVL